MFTGAGKRKTSPTRVCDVVFRDRHRIASHDEPELHLAAVVSVDFGEQQSGVKDKTVSQDNNKQPILNPVCLYASTIRRLVSYPKFDTNFTFQDGSKFSKISSQKVLHDLRCSVECIREEVLGFTSNKVGTHFV